MEKLFDPSLCENSHLKMIRRCIGIGLLCTQEKPNDRPTMWEILDMLDRKNKLPTPRKPRYIKWNSLPRQIVRSTNLKNEPFFCSNSSIIFNLPFSIVCRDEYICTKLFEIHTSAVLPILSWNYAQSYHYRKPGLCPVLKSLPSAKYRALGETWHSVNRALPSVWHSAK